MTKEEIQEKVRSTFREGDRVFVRFLTTIGKWYTILDIDYKSERVRLEAEEYTIALTFSEAIQYLSFTEYTLEPVGFSQERPKPKKKNGDPFEVGDEVWFIDQYGIKKGVVVRVDANKYVAYPISVIEAECAFPEDPEEWRFTSNGEFLEEGDITLFHQKPIITFED